MTHTAPNPISEEICKSFDPKFIEMLGEPTGEQHKAFCKLVEATQEKGLDWWHINLPEKKLAFCGRKNPKASKASASLLVYNAKTKNIKTPRGSSKLFGSLGNLTKKPLEEQIGHLLTELETGFLKSDPILKPRDHGEKYLPNKLPYEDVDLGKRAGQSHYRK